MGNPVFVPSEGPRLVNTANKRKLLRAGKTIANTPYEATNNVSDARAKGREWVLTREALDRFLSCLDADPDHAGRKYEAIRQKLVKIFDWRGARFPDECADETINRVVRKLEYGQEIRDIPTYCQGVARLVLLESLKKAENRQVSLDELKSVPVVPVLPDDDTVQRRCFVRCLTELPIESRQLILEYYEDERRMKINNRQAIADQLGIPLNALRSRVQRIRHKLEQCITHCVSRSLY
jgi:DNA-directed RNA polymerase specialized sigma24 family protein